MVGNVVLLLTVRLTISVYESRFGDWLRRCSRRVIERIDSRASKDVNNRRIDFERHRLYMCTYLTRDVLRQPCEPCELFVHYGSVLAMSCATSMQSHVQSSLYHG